MSKRNGNGKPPEEDPTSIGNVLLELRLCTKEQLKNAVEEQQRRLGHVLLDMDVISEDELDWALLYQRMLKNNADPETIRSFIREKRRAVFSELRQTSTRLVVLAEKMNKA